MASGPPSCSISMVDNILLRQTRARVWIVSILNFKEIKTVSHTTRNKPFMIHSILLNILFNSRLSYCNLVYQGWKIRIQALKIRIQALQIRIQALKIRIQALKIRIQALKI